MLLALTVSLFGALVTTAGVFVVRARADWAQARKAYFIAFAAGVLVSVALLRLVSEAMALTSAAPAGILGGFVFLHLLNRFVVASLCDRPETAGYSLGLIPLLGVGLHSLLDGVIYSVSFTVGETTGLLVAPGLIIHEFPEGIVTYTLLLYAGFPDRRAVLLALGAAAFSTPLGTLLSFPIVGALDQPTLGLLLSISAGALLYVGATHLLPHTERDPARFSMAALFAGILVAVIIGALEG